MIDSYITRSVVAAITSKQKPDWNYFDDLMIWALENCQDQAAKFVLAAKLADPSLTIKSFDFYSWDKFVRVNRRGEIYDGNVFWEQGNKMSAWMFFLIAAEGVCCSPVKMMSGYLEFYDDDFNFVEQHHLFGPSNVNAVWPGYVLGEWADVRRILEEATHGRGSLITGENGYSVITQPDEGYGIIHSLNVAFNNIPIIRALNTCRRIFVDSVDGDYKAPSTGGELYIYQKFDTEDICNRLYRRGDKKDPFCEGKTAVSYNFRGMEYFLMELVNTGDGARPFMGLAEARYLQARGQEIQDAQDSDRPSGGEIWIDLAGLTTLDEFALFMLDKGYINSMLNKLRVTTDGGRNLPPTLYLHFLTRAELAKLDEEDLEELEVFL